jgi:predicted enzyme related to lactoylglutathione lyase
MAIKIGSIVWGVRNIKIAVEFWSRALDYKLKREPSDDWAILIPREGNGIQLSLKLVTSTKPRRHHIDLFTDDQEFEVNRLLQLGATRKENWRYEQSADYVVLVDPEGNSFCVVQK